jgi:hypothetical protein
VCYLDSGNVELLRDAGGSVLKKSLTEPTLLEMSDKRSLSLF